MPSLSISSLKRLWPLLKQSFSEYSDDKVSRLSAALAFYTMLSIAPMLIICVKIVGVMFGNEAARGQVDDYIQGTMGAKAATAIQDMIANAGKSGSGILATIISSAILLFSASSVFGELQDSMNTVFEVKPKPNTGIWQTVKDRFFSMTLVLGVAFLLLVSLVLTTVLSGFMERLGDLGVFAQILNQVISFVIITGLFALMFKYIPDVKLSWTSAFSGAVLTAVLFTIGKFLLGLYLSRGSVTSVYGAAGSLVALLLWVYYSSQILFIGAEFTQAYAHQKGDATEPTENAVMLTETDRQRRGFVRADKVKEIANEQQGKPSGHRPRKPVAKMGRPQPALEPSKLYWAGGALATFGAGVLAGLATAMRDRRQVLQADRPTTNADVSFDRFVRKIQADAATLKASHKSTVPS